MSCEIVFYFSPQSLARFLATCIKLANIADWTSFSELARRSLYCIKIPFSLFHSQCLSPRQLTLTWTMEVTECWLKSLPRSRRSTTQRKAASWRSIFRMSLASALTCTSQSATDKIWLYSWMIWQILTLWASFGGKYFLAHGVVVKAVNLPL